MSKEEIVEGLRKIEREVSDKDFWFRFVIAMENVVKENAKLHELLEDEESEKDEQ